ncbi:MAG: ABC transporter permease [Rhizobiales bacterium]|nr:ABC transporter permease [Hyphomicrobiales bacterium]
MMAAATGTTSLLGGLRDAISQRPTLNRALPAIVSLAILLAVAGALIPSFLLPERLLMLGQQVAPLALVAIGQTLVVLIGGIDLSVGSVLTFSLVLGAGIARGSNEMLPLAILVCLGAGAAIGAVNGLLVTRLRLPALISTLATAVMVDGAAWVYTNGAPNGSMPELLQYAANGKLGIVPVADVIVALVFAAVLVLLTRTVFGRRLYAVGANPRTARLTGIRVEHITVTAYVLCGVLAAAAGLMLGGYIAVGSLKAGEAYVLNSLAVVLIGGTSLSGGEGGVVGTIIGVAILAVLTALLIQLGVPIALRSVLLAIIVVVGAILQGRRMAT